MNIATVDIGYIGLVSGTRFAEMGVHVTYADVNREKVENLQNDRIPIYEPGLDEMVMRSFHEGGLSLTTHLTSVLNDVDIVFCTMGTPPDEGRSADLRYVLAVARQFGENIQKYTLLVIKSTISIGTAQKMKAVIQAELDKRCMNVPLGIASNPEFLKEGTAIKDFMSPNRVMVGVESKRAKESMGKLYRPFLLDNFRVVLTDIPSTEMMKYAANPMLATHISFTNDTANLCELVGADVNMVRKGIGSDSRIGSKSLYPGCGYGGSCFPKDVKALMKTAEKHGYKMRVLNAVEPVNEKQKSVLFNKLFKHYKGALQGKKIAVWRLALKPETGDMREATSLVTIDRLLREGCKVRVYNPMAMEECRCRMGGDVEYAADMYDTVLEVDALLIQTEWKQFRLPNWSLLLKLMNNPVIIDGWNIHDAEELQHLSFGYYCIGR